VLLLTLLPAADPSIPKVQQVCHLLLLLLSEPGTPWNALWSSQFAAGNHIR
jgi:hypothetical protein